MEHNFDIEKLLNIDISPFLNKNYIDMLNKLDDLNQLYNDVQNNVSDILDMDTFNDLYRSHMSMTAAFDSSRLGIKGKDRRLILEESYKSRYKSIERHIKILKEEDVTFDIDYIKRIHWSLSPDDVKGRGVFRTLPKIRRAGSNKMYCSQNIEKDLKTLVEFINSKEFGRYTLVNVSLVQLGILSIAPFSNLNRFVAITLADKLIEKHYGKPIFMETVLFRFGNYFKDIRTLLNKYYTRYEVTDLMELYIKAMMMEMDSNMKYLKKLEKDIRELHGILVKTNIKEKFLSSIIRFIILNNTFKIKDLHNKLGLKDRRTTHKITLELSKAGVIMNISDSRVRRFKVEDKWINDFKLMYK